jgi:hypothetical protein
MKIIVNESKLKRILKEELDEMLDGSSYSDLRNGNHSQPIVYQLAFSNRLANIFKNGFSREFAASAGGNAYCTGLYTTFDLRSTIKNSETKKHLYGDAIIKMAIQSYDRFFIANYDIARQVYGENYRLKDQLRVLFKGYPQKYQEILNSPYYGRIINITDDFTSKNIIAFLSVMGGMSCRCDGQLNKYDIRGLVFKGHNDGYVSVIRDYKAILPIAYSMDSGKNWRNDLFTKDSFEKISNDNDPIIWLGSDAESYINPKTFRIINGYMRVQRKSDGLFNFLSAEDKSILSPIWFKSASDMDENQMALVEDTEGNRYYVGPYGFYENEDDEYPFKDFYEDSGNVDDDEEED